MIEYMKGHEGVWSATGIEIAEWWLKQNFSENPRRCAWPRCPNSSPGEKAHALKRSRKLTTTDDRK